MSISSGMYVVVSLCGKVCEGEARPNQRALVGVYQQMPQSWLLWGRSSGPLALATAATSGSQS